MDIYENYKFIMDYFKNAIEKKNNKIPQCVLFWGEDINAQYEIAKEISRLLNCKGDRSTSCDCLSCKWIEENAHPAVLTFSKDDNKPSDDETKNVISIAQARTIKEILTVTSDYHRIFILCDRDSKGNPCGLNPINFPPDTANALLKTFEEPPANTTFFFLTKDITEIIQTVVSRSQTFFVPSFKEEPQNFELVKDIISDYLEIERNDVLEFNDRLYELTKETEPEEIFTQMQNYMINLLKSNLNNTSIKYKLIKDINSVEKAKQELKLNMNIQTITENLCYKLIL